MAESRSRVHFKCNNNVHLNISIWVAVLFNYRIEIGWRMQYCGLLRWMFSLQQRCEVYVCSLTGSRKDNTSQPDLTPATFIQPAVTRSASTTSALPSLHLARFSRRFFVPGRKHTVQYSNSHLFFYFSFKQGSSHLCNKNLLKNGSKMTDKMREISVMLHGLSFWVENEKTLKRLIFQFFFC